nr:hypothetical protein [Tanacetum cinerariifolium]
MLKAQIKVVDIMCDLELIYPSALFDIMIHLVIYLPLEALKGGPICPRWMFPFERYMKKLKGYVRNKAKPEGSIAKGYVTEEALIFISHYFRDVTMKFNRLDRNVDPPPPTCQFQIHQHRIDNDKDPEVSTTNELFALACGPTWTPILINSCAVDSVRYDVQHRTTQNNGVCLTGPDGEMYYGQLQEILEFKNNMTQIDTKGEAFKNDQYILLTQVKQVFYLEDKAKPYLEVVEHVNHKKFFDGGVIVVEDDPDIIHFDNSSDLLLSTSLNDLDNATLHIDGQSTEVDAPPDIIDVVDKDDDIIDDEDARPHDLAASDDEDLINVDDDGVDKMLADVAQSHDGDNGGEDCPPPHHVPIGCEGCFANQCKGKRKPNLGSRAAGRLHTRDKTRNLSLKEITDKKGPEVIRGVPLYYPSWLKRQSSTTQEYPSLIDTFFMAHTVNGEEMRRLEATDTYNDDEINRLARRGKQRGHIPGVDRVLPARVIADPSRPAPKARSRAYTKSGSGESDECGDDEESADDQEDEDEDGDGDS